MVLKQVVIDNPLGGERAGVVISANAGGPVEPAVGGGANELAVANGKLATNRFVEGSLGINLGVVIILSHGTVRPAGRFLRRIYGHGSMRSES